MLILIFLSEVTARLIMIESLIVIRSRVRRVLLISCLLLFGTAEKCIFML